MNLEEKLEIAIKECNVYVDWSETDGSDVKEILKEFVGERDMTEHKAELMSLMDTKDFGLSPFQKQLVYEKLGGKKNHFYKA